MKQPIELRRAIAGGAFWLFLWWQQRPPIGHENWSVLLLLFAPLVLVPLALALYRCERNDGNEPAFVGLLWRLVDVVQLPAALVLAVAMTQFDTGPLAGVLALPWLAVTGVLSVIGLVSIWRRGIWPPVALCRDAALVYIVVGGFGAVMDRFGIRPLDFAPVIILLTAVHFHYAAFVLPLFAALAGRRVGGVLATVTSLAVIAGVPLVAIGINATQVGAPPQLETAAAYVMVTGGVLTALLHVILSFDGRRPALVRVLWLISAVGLGFSMVLAAMYATRFFADLGWLLIPKMSAWHGTANALVFALLGVVAWRMALAHEAMQETTSPDEGS